MADAKFRHSGTRIDVAYLNSHVEVEVEGDDTVGDVVEAVSVYYSTHLKILSDYALIPASRPAEVLPTGMEISELVRKFGSAPRLELIAQDA